MIDLRLNPALDVEALNARFKAHGHVQVADVLVADAAAGLHRCLTADVPWGLAYYDGGAKYLRRHELERMSADARRRLEQQILVRARSSYQYAYSAYPVLDAYLQQWDEVPVLDGFLEAWNSEPVLTFIRAVTGFADVVKADAQATRYGPGQFLRQHHDQSPSDETWLVAYVYNLTPAWQPDWGGYLQLLDRGGDVVRGLMPRFNALNLMAVPQPHMVSQVSTFAGAARYSITGWFRSR